jgi:hypothetical protein
MTKSAIYAKALEWFATKFNDSKSVLEVKDPDTGLIMGKGILPSGGRTVIGTTMAAGMTIKLEIKDGKYRTTYDGFTVGTRGTERQPEPGYEHDAVKKSAQDLDADLAAFIAKKPKDF